MNLVEEVDRAEEAANRILEAFSLDEGHMLNDDQFDRLCDIIEEAGRFPAPVKVCGQLANARLPQDVVTAVLLTLLKDHFKRMRERLARRAQPPADT